MDWKIRQYSSIQGIYDDNEETIYNDIGSNPGTELDDIITRTGLSDIIVKNVVQVMVDQNIIKLAHDTTGSLDYYFHMNYFVDLIISNRVNARLWAANNDGGLVSQMATDLSLHIAIARSLAEFLEQEKSVVLTRY